MKLSDILITNMTKEEFHESVLKEQEIIDQKRKISIIEKGKSIQEKFPDCKYETIKLASYALKGEVMLPGTGGEYQFIGDPPNWFYKGFKDEEFIWQLNRMNHWIPLLSAYTLTGEKKYAEKVIGELEDWINRHERPPIVKEIRQATESFYNIVDASAWRVLDVGIRLHKTWPLIIEHLIHTQWLTPELLERFALSIYEQAEIIAELAPMFFPKADHNHYIMENLGLLWVAGRFKQFKNAEKWKKQAIDELERCIHIQMTEDGGHVEGCPMYHSGCIRWFALGVLFSKDFSFTFSKGYMQRLEKGLEYAIQTFRPSGTIVPHGDSKTNVEAISAAFFGSLIFQREDYLQLLLQLTSKKKIIKEITKYIWYANHIDHIDDLLAAKKDELGDFSLPTVSWQKKLDQCTMRTDWGKEAISIHFACHTPVYAGHSHIDPCGFDLTAFGKPVIVDPGVFTYRNIEERRMFKSATWHNTLTIDNKEPFEYIDTWNYGSQKEGCITDVYKDENMMYAVAQHFNYEPAIHKRLISIIDNRFVIVLDQIDHIHSDSNVQIYYHMDSICIQLGENGRSAWSQDEDINVGIFASQDLQAERLTGKISDQYDVVRDSTRIRFNDVSNKEQRVYGMVIVPYKTHKPIHVKDVSLDQTGNQVNFSFTFNKHYQCLWDERGLRCTN